MDSTPSKVRYGIIGCGMMGQEHLRNIALLPDAAVTRIFEPDDVMAQASLAQAAGAQRAASLAEVVMAAGGGTSTTYNFPVAVSVQTTGAEGGSVSTETSNQLGKSIQQAAKTRRKRQLREHFNLAARSGA